MNSATENSPAVSEPDDSANRNEYSEEVGCLVVAASCAAWLLLCATVGRRYHVFLKAQGYEWLGVGDAAWILLRCGPSAYRLPPAIDYMVPPRTKNDIAGVIKFAKSLAAYKRRARRKRH